MKNKRRSQWIFKFTLITFYLSYSITLLAQQTKKHAAFIVIGQPDFTSDSVNQGGTVKANTLNTPGQTLILNGKFIVADALNNRVLIYNSIPTANNVSADVVIGQYDFTHNSEDHGLSGGTAADALDRPSGLATDDQKLFVLDRDNHRVLIYNSLPVTNGASADIVIGHRNMTDDSWGGESSQNDTLGLSAYKLSSGPTGLVYDEMTGKLIVYDSDNDRVLIYNHIPDSNGVPADVAIGQPDFNHNKTNQDGLVGPNTLDLSTCAGVATYNGKLFIADRENNRVLIYNKIPTTNNALADVVIGQVDFNHNKPNKGGSISAYGMSVPRTIAFDKLGRLYIAEARNSRILVYNQIPVSNGVAANNVIGQPDFTTGAYSTTDSTFYDPYHLLIKDDKLILSDPGNNRILFFTIDNSSAIIEHNSIVLYPNPNQGTFNLTFNKNPINPIHILIVDMLGRVIYTKLHEAINGKLKLTLSNLKAGKYTLTILGEEINESKSILVVK